MDIIIFIINVIFYTILLGAFFKISRNTTYIKDILLNKSTKPTNNINDIRAEYYKYLTLGDNEMAYEQLLYIVFRQLTDSAVAKEDRKSKYDSLKTHYTPAFDKLNRKFPDYPF